ncbi:MAG: hypothetical protein ACW991_10485 [Candidatus Hodarchaeales archaeon]|jgi:hypothetical protein
MVDPKPSMYIETNYSDRVTFMRGHYGGPDNNPIYIPDLTITVAAPKKVFYL